MNITELLTISAEQDASDTHLSAGMPPIIRVDGEARKIDMPPMENEQVQRLVYEVMTDKQRAEFEESFEVDFAFEIPQLARFRANVFNQSRGLGAAFRIIPQRIPSMQDLGMGNVFEQICSFSNGLVLVTGPTGSGKSSTLAAMIDYINQSKHEHILTIEDPIEFVHSSSKCLVTQREVHRDTQSFSEALRSSMRQDPDIILVGEIRDLETMRLAMTAAETGHLVFATLHTSSATSTVNRIIDVFPAAEKQMIRTMLSQSLRAVVAQTLLKRIAGGRVAAHEIMLGTSAICNMIREDKITQMYSALQTGAAIGMQTLDQSLLELYQNKVISLDEAKQKAKMPAAFS